MQGFKRERLSKHCKVCEANDIGHGRRSSSDFLLHSATQADVSMPSVDVPTGSLQDIVQIYYSSTDVLAGQIGCLLT